MPTKEFPNGKWRFCQIQFVKKDRERIEQLTPSPEEILDMISAFALGGYKVGFSFSQKDDCYICAITSKGVSGPDKDKTFTLYHSQFARLLRGFAYVYEQSSDADSLSRLYDVRPESEW